MTGQAWNAPLSDQPRSMRESALSRTTNWCQSATRTCAAIAASIGLADRVNGLIAPFRPMTMESVAGKNAVTHVGKLYSIAASLISQRVVEQVPGVMEAQCLLVSRIGHLRPQAP